jgi:hypothetical protein
MNQKQHSSILPSIQLNNKVSTRSEGMLLQSCLSFFLKKTIVIAFEMQLQEVFLSHPKTPSRDRINHCFAILEEVIPRLGPWSLLIKKIYDELFKSVYSNSLTSTSLKEDNQIEKIPYFTAVNRIKELK